MKRIILAIASILVLCSCGHKVAENGNKLVVPVPSGLNLEDLTDADVAAAFSCDDFNWMGGNLRMTVYAEQLYDAVDVHNLAVGDSVLYSGDTLIVNLKEEKNGEVSINGGYDNNGISLWPYEGGTYRAVEYDDHSVYVKLGVVELPLKDDFTVIDCHDDPQEPSDTIRTDQKLYLENLKDSRREFISLNTKVLIENGVITNITRRWIP